MKIFTIAIIGIIGTVLSVSVKSYRPEFGILVGLITGIIIISAALDSFFSLAGAFKNIISKTGINAEYFKITLKVIGISYITDFSSELCRDSGEGAIAEKIDSAGKICIMLLTLPIISEFLNMVLSMLSVL